MSGYTEESPVWIQTREIVAPILLVLVFCGFMVLADQVSRWAGWDVKLPNSNQTAPPNPEADRLFREDAAST